MSSILSAQNLQTLRRRNIGRRWPCCLSPAFLSALRPRPPDRFCPNTTSDLHSVKAIVVAVLDLDLNIGRRWPCCLSPAFLSALRPRPPDRFCPNTTSDLHSVKAIVVAVLD